MTGHWKLIEHNVLTATARTLWGSGAVAGWLIVLAGVALILLSSR